MKKSSHPSKEHVRPCIANVGSISVIIPIAPHDQEWMDLLPLLQDRLELCEIILSVSEGCDQETAYEQACAASCLVRIVRGSQGRARQINRALEVAKGAWIWILHADSRFAAQLWPQLAQAQSRSADALHFFDLTFRDGGARMRLNACGVFWRSWLFGMPFGDQGFFFRKELGQRVGKFSESAPYGEDHLFVWQWRQAGFKLSRIPFPLATSSRKYQEHGWWQTSKDHLCLSWRQAVPEMIKLGRMRMRQLFRL